MDKESMEMFQKILDRLDTMDGRLDMMDGRLDTMDGRLDMMDGRLDTMDGRFGTMDSRLDTLEGQFAKMSDHLDIIEMKQDLTAKKLDDLHLDFKIFERDTKKNFHKLNDEMDTVIEILRANELIPS